MIVSVLYILQIHLTIIVRTNNPHFTLNNNLNNNTMFDFPLLYLFVNLYTGDSKWCSLEEGNNLGEYWEQDITQKPIPVYPDDWI